MAIEPYIEVIEGATVMRERTPGIASSIAVIGAFDSEVTDLTLVSDDTIAHEIFGTTGTVGAFKGTDAIDGLFYGASSLLVANITTYTTGDNPTAETTLTNAKLQSALNLLKDEVFDILFIAEELTDEAQTIVSTWLDREFKNKFAHGQVAQIQRANAAAYTTSIATFKKHVYWMCTQAYNGLSLNQSAALMAGYIASLQVNRSLTFKEIPMINSVSPNYLTESGEIGAKLLELNVPFIRARDRLSQKYICVNSKLPDGLDLYINRVRDYVVNRMEAERLLGEIVSPDDLESATAIAENVREECVDDLELLEDIIFSVRKLSGNCIEISLDKLIFNDVIEIVKIPFNIEVQ